VPLESPLSVRENEIALLYAGGSTHQTIAKQLYIAPSTVRSHLASIYRKLKLSSKLELKARLDANHSRAHATPDNGVDIYKNGEASAVITTREKMMGAVLDIIAQSDGNVDTVSTAILTYALKLCDADSGFQMDYLSDGWFRASFSKGIPAGFQKWLDDANKFSLHSSCELGRLAVTRKTINITDTVSFISQGNPEPLCHAIVNLGGARSLIAIPMVTDGALEGVFTVFRQDFRPFTPEVVTFVSSFVNLSMVAITNARAISTLRTERENYASRN